jgi:chaperonin GroEL
MEFDRGWMSAHFVTDPTTQRAELANARVLIHEKKISAAADLLPVLELCAQDGAPLLIIAEDIEGEALAMLVVNKLRGILQCAAVKAPGFGDRRTAMLQDLAILTGATPVMEGLGRKLDQITLAELGTAARVSIEKGKTQLIDGGGERQALQGRCALIRKELSEANSTYDKDKLEERLAKLEGGVCELLVGGATESEVKERKARVEDALAAVRAAAEEGLVTGGGTALIRAEAAVAKLDLAGDEALGAQAVGKALSVVVRTLAANGGENPGVIAERVRNAKGHHGYNALTGEIEDLAKAGVLEPAKVLRCALEHAASIGTTLLSLDAAIAEAPAN